ncbi:HD-GYP domain-containing protein (c-di-GMP phosphodiesterase class II) [Ureibacillus xyleni]|uniref:HD-GYP domain-containing protein (C-di-GMP phosphodiesterase class II) n=1 Tax=Ureibacillus xyleni TaxID=614648 RepID=A0A285SKY5_9BACL|nr:HD domain-containing phosphohydrolase [Ureibacillus xyleni]SOC08654.1 HD-GYP domain-containing protein (c-di-GMP phosphodiesterase class II) [Ureibacillus xyleni]
MSNIDIQYIRGLKKGEVIPNDIYFNKTLLIKAGTQIDDMILKNLKSWGITKLNSLYIKNDNHPDEELLQSYQTAVKKKEKIFYSKELFDIKKLFFESLQYVVSETRYGLILNSDTNISWLENLFISSLLNTEISIALFNLKKKDPYSYYHTFDVFLLGSLLAEKSGIKDVRSFAMGCLLHDIGKLDIGNELLQKEGALSKAEFDEIQKHTLYGIDFIVKHKIIGPFLDIVKSHHERLDGTGYPEGLKGDDLSEEVRLLGVVDTYSALTLQRAYREAFPAKKAIELLLSKGNKYDIKYVIKLMELINIYPTSSIVKLSNGKKARIRFVNDNQPYFPILEEIGTRKVYQLPLNFSVTISRFVEWDQVVDTSGEDSIDKKELYWNYFSSNLISGNMEEALNFYNLLTDGLGINNIFIDVIVRLIKEIESKKLEGELSTGEEHDAFLRIKDILVTNLK